MSELENYVKKTTEPVLSVSDLWKEKTGMDWEDAKNMGLTDGSYNKNIQLLNKLKKGESADVIPYIYGDTSMEEIIMRAPKEQNVRDQQKIVRDGSHDLGLPYAIVDKKSNDMFLFDNNNMLSREKVITGRDNKDVDEELSMKQWLNLPENKGKDHDEYFKYLDDHNGQVTPSGMYTIGSHRKNVTENPDMVGNLINFFRPEKKAKIESNRAKSYGDKGELFTFYNEDGVYSSKAIHGTGYEDRVAAIASGKGGDLSNGCINVGKKSLCFETLQEGSRVFIMPETTNDLVQPKSNGPVKSNSIVNDADKFAREARHQLRAKGIKVSDEELKKMYTIHQLESKGGKDYGVKDTVLDNLGIANSKGEYQINEKTFSDYLPKDYNWKDNNSQQEAVLNFIKENEDLPMQKLYNLYNTGKASRKSKNSPRLTGLKRILGLE